MVSIEPVTGSDDDSSSVDSEDEVMAAVADFEKDKSSRQRQQGREIPKRRLASAADMASSSESEESSESEDDEDEEEQQHSEEEQEEQAEENTAGFRESLSLQERLERTESRESMALKASRERRASAKKRAREILLQSRTKKGRKGDDKKLASKKKSRSAVHSEEERSSSDDEEEAQQKRKRSKHAPAEVSSRRGRQHLRSLNESGIGIEIGARRYQPRDPRMSNLTGHFDSKHFEHHYGFLDGMRDKEMKVLQEKLKALKQSGRKGQRLRRKLGCVTSGKEDQREQQRALMAQLTQWKQQKAFQKQQRLERDAKHAVKEKLRQNVANNGSSAIYYPKRKEMRQLQQQAKLEQLRKGGGEGAVEKYLTRKRKKQKSQDSSRLRL